MYKFGFLVALVIFCYSVEGQQQQNRIKVSSSAEKNYESLQESTFNNQTLIALMDSACYGSYQYLSECSLDRAFAVVSKEKSTQLQRMTRRQLQRAFLLSSM